MADFNPQEHMSKLKGNDYLEVKWRLAWFRAQYPQGSIVTDMLRFDNQECIVHARAETGEGGVATGLGYQTLAGWKQGYVQKAETDAIGRALAALGFGTQFCEDFDFGEGDPDKVVDAPVQRTSRPSAPPQSQAVRPAPPAEPVVTPPAANGGADERAERAFWESLGSDGIDESAVSGLLNGLTPAGYRAKHGLTWSQMIADVRKRHQLAQPVGDGRGRR